MILSYLRCSEIFIPKQARNPLFLAGSQALVHRDRRRKNMSVEVLFPRVRKASPKERYLWQNGPKDAFTEAITCSNRPKDMEFPAGGEVGRE